MHNEAIAPEAATRTAGLTRSVLRSSVSNRDFRAVLLLQPYLGSPIPREPAAPIVQIETDKLNAHRVTVRAAMAARPGQRPKCKIVDDFNAFIWTTSGGRKG